MLVEEPSVTGVISRAYDMDEISLVRLHRDCDVLSTIHERAARWRGSAIGGLTACRLVGGEQVRHLLLVPVRERKRNLLIEMERRTRVVDDQRTPEPIRELAQVVRVVPICTSFVDL